MSDRLTPKQEMFVNGLVRGMSQREAYSSAYRVQRMKPESIDVAASRALASAKVRLRYDELTAAAAAQATWDRARAIRTLERLLRASESRIELTYEVEKETVLDADGTARTVERKHYDVPRDASKRIVEIVAELNKLCRLYESPDGDGGGVTIVDNIPRAES